MRRGDVASSTLLPKSRGLLRGPVIPNQRPVEGIQNWFKDANLIEQYNRNVWTSTDFRGRFGQLIQMFITSSVSSMASVILNRIMPLYEGDNSRIDIDMLMINGGPLDPRGDLAPSTKRSIAEDLRSRNLKQYGRAIDIDSLLRRSPDFMTFFDTMMAAVMTDLDNTLTMLAWQELYDVGADNLQREYNDSPNAVDPIGVQFRRAMQYIGVVQTADADIASRYLVGRFSEVFPASKPIVWIDVSAKKTFLPSAAVLVGTQIERKFKEDLQAGVELYRAMAAEESLLFQLGGIEVHCAAPIATNGVVNTAMRKDRGMLERVMVLMEYYSMLTMNKPENPLDYTSRCRNIWIKGGPQNDTIEEVSFIQALRNSFFFATGNRYETLLMTAGAPFDPARQIRVTDMDIIYMARVMANKFAISYPHIPGALADILGRFPSIAGKEAAAVGSAWTFFVANLGETTIGSANAAFVNILNQFKFWNPHNTKLTRAGVSVSDTDLRQMMFGLLLYPPPAAAVYRGLNPLEVLCASFCSTNVYDSDTILRMYESGLDIPLNVDLFRAMKVKSTDLLGSVSGPEFGRVFYKQPDLAFGEDPYTKETHYHLTLDALAVVLDRNGVHLSPGYTVDGFLAGMGTGIARTIEEILSPKANSNLGLYPVVYDNIDASDNQHPACTNILGMNLLSTNPKSYLSYGESLRAHLNADKRMPLVTLIDLFKPDSPYRLYAPACLGPYRFINNGIPTDIPGKSYAFSNESFYDGSARVHSMHGRTNHPPSIRTW